jgi:nicotinate phosphoribosyltransferase
MARRVPGVRWPDLEALRRLRFTGEVWAVPEGTAVFAGEPLVEVTAPIAEAQLAETVLLNHVTFQTEITCGSDESTAAGIGSPAIESPETASADPPGRPATS